jgi:3-oxoadipate enol-lactonase
MSITTVGGIELYYQREGGGPPILFISGLGGAHNSWAPSVALLKQRYACITFDNRGIGQSSMPQTGYTIPDLTRDTLSLLDKLSISHTHIIGMSMGGLIAQSIALQEPERVGGLVLVSSFAAPCPRLMHVLNSRKFLQKKMDRHEYTWALAAWMLGPASIGKPGFVDAFAKKAADNPYPQAQHAYDQLVDGIGQFDSRAQLEQIRQPTLVMVGEHDVLTTPHQAKALAEGITGAELVVLPDVGHSCHLEDPHGFTDRIDRFLKNLDPR